MNRSLFESLERRQLLAADLTVSAFTTTLPDSLLTGVASKPATANVTVGNGGTAIAKTTKGNVTVTVSLRDSGGTLHAIGSQGVAATKLGKATVKLTVPSSLPAGPYTLVTSVSGGAVVTEDNTSNNSVDGKTVTIAAANADVQLINTSAAIVGSAASGVSETFVGSIKNVGNVDAKTSGKVEITSTVGGVTSVIATIDKLNLNLKPNASLPIKATTFKVAGTSGATIAATIGARFVASPALSGDVAGNNAVTLGTLAVTPPPPGPLDAIHLGSKMTFKQTSGISHSGVGFESGNWNDDGGHSGTYYFTTAGTNQGLLGLKNAAGAPLATIAVTVNAGTPKLTGSTFTFGVPQAGSLGSWNVAGQTVYFKK